MSVFVFEHYVDVFRQKRGNYKPAIPLSDTGGHNCTIFFLKHSGHKKGLDAHNKQTSLLSADSWGKLIA